MSDAKPKRFTREGSGTIANHDAAAPPSPKCCCHNRRSAMSVSPVAIGVGVAIKAEVVLPLLQVGLVDGSAIVEVSRQKINGVVPKVVEEDVALHIGRRGCVVLEQRKGGEGPIAGEGATGEGEFLGRQVVLFVVPPDHQVVVAPAGEHDLGRDAESGEPDPGVVLHPRTVDQCVSCVTAFKVELQRGVEVVVVGAGHRVAAAKCEPDPAVDVAVFQGNGERIARAVKRRVEGPERGGLVDARALVCEA